jgi:predicted PurR-regulated permease PerM
MTEGKIDRSVNIGGRLPPMYGFLLIMAAFVVVVAGMKAAEAIVVPFLLSIFIAILCTPFMYWLQRRGVPTLLAILFMAVILLTVGVLLGALIGTSLNSFTKNLPEYQQTLQNQMSQLRTWLEGKGIELPDKLKWLNPGAIMALVSNLFTQLTGMLTNGFLIFVTVVFILLEASIFPDKLSSALNRPKESFSQLSKITSDVKRYLAIKTLTSAITGLTVGIWLILLDVDYPLLWAVLAFFLNFVPNIGSIIAAVPPILVALIQQSWISASLVTAGYVVVNMVVGNFMEPRIMGRGLGLSTLVVFLSLVFWGWVLGPIGMLLSVPLTMTIKVALESNRDTRWIAIILGSEPRPDLLKDSDTQSKNDYQKQKDNQDLS